MARPIVDNDTFHKRMRKEQAKWDKSEEYEEAKAVFDQAILTSKYLNINQAIYYGLGCLSWDDDPGDAGDAGYPPGANARSQFIAFRTFLGWLAEKFTFTNGIYFQGSDFTDGDTKLIESFGYKILDAKDKKNNAVSRVTSETFLFMDAIGDAEFNLDFIRNTQVALLIGPNVDPEMDPEETHIGKDAFPELGKVDPATEEWRWSSSLERFRTERDGAAKIRNIKHRRIILRNFQSTHLFRRLWVQSGLPQWYLDVPIRERWRKGKLPPKGMEWILEMFIYWRPDNKPRLRIYQRNDDIPCQCIHCQNKLVLYAPEHGGGTYHGGFWRPASPVTPPGATSHGERVSRVDTDVGYSARADKPNEDKAKPEDKPTNPDKQPPKRTPTPEQDLRHYAMGG